MEAAIIVSFVLNGLMGIAMYFMKLNHENTKERIKTNEDDVRQLRESTLRKEDFKEFKAELRIWLDEMKADVREALAKK
jgi:hypothetical protein